MAQMVKNLPVMRETWVQFLDWKYYPGGGNDSPLQCCCLEGPHGQRSLAGSGPLGLRATKRSTNLKETRINLAKFIIFVK